MTRAVAKVLLDSPLPQLDHLFDYAVPEELAELAVPGVRVRVPFRSKGRLVDGYLVELVPAGAPATEFRGTLSAIDTVVSAAAVLRPEVWTLARALADRAAGNASDIIRLAVPPRQVRVEKAWLAGSTAATVTTDAVGSAALVAPAFADYPVGRLDTALAGNERIALAAVPRLVELPGASTVGAWAHTLAELAVATLQGGRSAILVVPDFRDQDQLQAALALLAPAGSVRRVDARQANPERYRSFLACLGEEPGIIIGNRSAVYAPAAQLGLIALWDDGDPLHAEPLSPYVHSRDAALVRREQAQCALVLLGHSRSVETQRLVEIGWLTEVTPTTDRHPRVIPTDFQSEPDQHARTVRIPTAAWNAARQALDEGPVLVQVASPGYAPMLACQSCKKAARCVTCQGPLGLASARATPACRWCGHLAVGWACSHCDGRSLRVITLGTGRTAEELGRAFPGVRILIADGEHRIQHLDASPALVIATRGAEPIPAGGYRAILLLDGERMLARESLRVGEDCLRWWANTAALAAPGASVLLVGVGGALARALNSWHPEQFASSELADRRQLRFPPAVRAASVTGTAVDVATAVTDLGVFPGVDVLGPVETDQSLVRAIVRFDYAHGADVARLLKAAVVRNASGRRRPTSGTVTAPPTLKVRFDDPELL